MAQSTIILTLNGTLLLFQVKLLPRPWHFQWHLHGYRGIDPESLYGQLTKQELSKIRENVEFVDRYDLMKMYR